MCGNYGYHLQRLRRLLSLRWVLFTALSLLVCSPSFSEDLQPSFDPKATYRVTGAELNSLMQDLLTARHELTTSRAENAKLAEDLTALQNELTTLKAESKSKEQALTELGTQLTTASELSRRLQSEALKNSLIVGGVSFGAGAILTALTFLLH